MKARVSGRALAALSIFRVAVLLAVVTEPLALSAQSQLTAEQARARLEVGAAFLKSGDAELATKTFAAVAEADPTNWHARSLLAIAYLSVRALDKVDIELKRLKTQNAPASTVAALERQLAAVKQTRQVRDDLTTLLSAGKWQDALTSIDASRLPDSRKQLLRAYLATLRGEFGEARRLTSDPQYAAINASIAKREQEFQPARERALVAANILGYRFCGVYPGEMRRCAGQAPLSRAQQAAWDDVRAGEGKVSALYMKEKTGWPKMVSGLEWHRQEMNRRNEAISVRVEVALRLLNEFVLLAPLHPDALRVASISSLYSGSQNAVREAAERSLNATGTWAISLRRCHGRADYVCSMGDEKVEQLPREGLIVLDARARALQFYDVEPKGWLTGFLPSPAAKLFEIPFGEIRRIESRPGVRGGNAIPYVDSERLLFGFGPKYQVSMLPDVTLLIRNAGFIPTAMKAVDDLVHVMGQLLPDAKVDYEAVTETGGGFGQAFLRASAIAAVGLGAFGNDISLVQEGQQALDRQQQQQQQQAAGVAALRQSLAEMKMQDGRSVVDVAFDDEGLKSDLDRLLTSVMP